jgi:glycosyltransferase involved in cell wall biosynthesis
MRIGIVTKWLDEPYTGIGQYTYNLINGLLAQDKKNDYIFIHRKGGDSDVYKHGEELFLPKTLPGPLWIVDANIFLSMQRKKLDVVHEPYLGLLLPSDFKQVITVHDLAPLLFRTGHSTFRLYFKTFMRKAARRADAIITVSENTKWDIHERFDIPKDRIHRIYNGVRHVDADPKRTKKVRKHLDIEGPYLLTVGSLLPVKNQALAIEAFAKAIEKGHIEHKLVLAGKKDAAYESLNALVKKLGIGKRVVFTDYLEWKDVISLYSAADIFLFPSLYEGFGFPPLEAMGHGVPVISSDASSLPEVVGDAGVLVNPKDKNAWAESIMLLAKDDSVRKELIRKGLERVKEFTWERSAKETLKVYEAVAKD